MISWKNVESNYKEKYFIIQIHSKYLVTEQHLKWPNISLKYIIGGRCETSSYFVTKSNFFGLLNRV